MRQAWDVRTYAIRLEDGTVGPDFNSYQEATHWGIENLPLEGHRYEFQIVYLREGEEVGGAVVFGFV